MIINSAPLSVTLFYVYKGVLWYIPQRNPLFYSSILQSVPSFCPLYSTVSCLYLVRYIPQCPQSVSYYMLCFHICPIIFNSPNFFRVTCPTFCFWPDTLDNKPSSSSLGLSLWCSWFDCRVMTWCLRSSVYSCGTFIQHWKVQWSAIVNRICSPVTV